MADTNQVDESSEMVDQNVLGQDDRIQQEVAQEVSEDTDVRKFQSMYDKAQAENQKLSSKVQKLEKFEPVANLLKERPDLVAMLQDNISGKQTQEPQLKEDEFNPWDAFYKPGSPSYKLREQEQNKAVNSAVNKQMVKIQEDMFKTNLKTDLKSTYKMNDSEADEFMNYWDRPKQDIELDVMVDVFRKSDGKPSTTTSSIEAVRANKEAPRSAGVIQGQQPQQKSEVDGMWDRVQKAGSRSNVL